MGHVSDLEKRDTPRANTSPAVSAQVLLSHNSSSQISQNDEAAAARGAAYYLIPFHSHTSDWWAGE